ncbi:adenine nucleotide alpha hydrolase [Rhizobium sp. TH2]|uniref:adenine nucleotide alpha hydrolase n=1 Tax=Rhizobium sp. TH2 TaxID=2775403 RepID=UPI002157CD53|nr:adenine nucleotide alpha hydrolase [Rhizobium sp. TH2]UVC06602.1 adenine nucleotide alpha hydrolase [Rhizobium sp. TH2]
MIDPTTRLEHVLARFPRLAVAVSGGVDSLTLATIAAHTVPDFVAVHAVSPAVPVRASERVREIAHQRNWRLIEIRAGEFADADYLSNPVNRCYFCKSNLYKRIRQVTDFPIAAGTNLDDLSDFRPGLTAAGENGVVHPFVEAQIDKKTLREIAARAGLGSVASLPAQPCLSSRVETGIRISERDLDFIDRVERLAEASLGPVTLRCRITSGGVRIETDVGLPMALADNIRELCDAESRPFLGIAAYRQGSAFVGVKA